MDVIYLLRLGATALTAFMLGSIPTSFLLGKYFYDIDPRQFGSGATGATNTARAMGPLAGIITALVDIAKGWLAVTFARSVFAPTSAFGASATFIAIGIALLAVIAGHAFTPWLGFRGGKGIAVAGGALIALSAPLFFIELAVLITVAALSGYVGLGSMVVAVTFPFLLALFAPTRHLELIVFGTAAALFIIWLHRSNIKRMRAGTENKLTFRDKTKSDKEC